MTTSIAHFSRRYRLSASHRLNVPTFTDQQNIDTFGKCNNPYGHGHNYFVEVTVRGPVDPQTGMVIDLVALDTIVNRELVARFDHTHLNVDRLFNGALVPSTENFAIQAEQILRPALETLATQQGSSFHLHAIRIEETRNNSFDYLSHAPHAPAPTL